MSRSALAASVRLLRSRLAAQQAANDSDEQLLHAFLANRENNAFAVLVRRYGPMVLHVCRRVLGHEQDAEDAFQATFLVLAQSAASLRNKTALASFLHGTAYRIALKAKQSAARRRKHEGRVPARPSINPADELSWREVRALVDEEVARLPEKYRSAIVLCCLENVSQAEAAQRLGLKEGTLSSRLTMARKLLSQRLTRRGVELTAVLATTTLAPQPSPALSPVLVASTIKAALSEEAVGLVSVHVAALVKSAASAAILSKAKILTAMLLAVSMLAGAGAWVTSSKPPIPQANTPSPAPQGNKEAAPRQKESEAITVKGRVLGPDGKPVKGARLYSARLRGGFPQDDVTVSMLKLTPIDANGRFLISLDKPNSEEYLYLIAHAAGFGVDWINLSEGGPSSDVTLRLVKDVPITGRVVNTEGRPVAGVSVSVARICVPANEKLDDYLNGWYQGLNKVLDTLNTPRKCLYAPLDAISGAATTDKDGRFTLHGAGGERIVHVAFSGGGVARSTPFVITRPGFDAKPYNAVLQNDKDGRKFLEGNRFSGLYPPEFTFVIEAGKTIEGVVKDADTGKPLAGCRVVTATSCQHGTSAMTNAEGKYRLEGLAKRASGYSVWVRPPKHSTYLDGGVYEAADTVGFTKVRLDFELTKGALVTGRAVDKRTGKGVRCFIRSIPLAGNKFYGSKPGFVDRGAIVTSRQIEAGEDGRFRLATIPGKVLLAASVDVEWFRGEPLRVYRQAVPDPDHKSIFEKDDDTWIVITAHSFRERLSRHNAVKVIDVKENGETRAELTVDRGATARIAVQDADGKPLAGAWAAGLTDSWPITYQLPEATATVYALNPEKPRIMAFFHAEKKLGGTATVRGDEKEPVVVKLAPVGQVSGRLLDGDGNPLEGVEVTIFPGTESGNELYRFAAPTGKPVHTNKDGLFYIEGVVPDLAFRLNLRKERTFFVGEPRIGTKQIKPSETLDLGDVRVKPAR